MPTITIDTSQRFTSGPQPEADVVCVHTTEGMSWPGYSGGNEAPHATIRGLPGIGISVREHIPTNQYAKALMNLPGGAETNRRGVLQYELVGTCDPAHRGQAGWYFWPDVDPTVLAALAAYLRPIMARYQIPHVAAPFKAYPASYGNSSARMSAATWNSFQGICGHQSVPENSHGDPGAFPGGKLVAALNGATPAPKPATPAAPKGWDVMATQAEIQAALKNLLTTDTDVQAAIARQPWLNTSGRSTTTRAAQLDQMHAGMAALLARDPETIDAKAVAAAIPAGIAAEVTRLLAARLAA